MVDLGQASLKLGIAETMWAGRHMKLKVTVTPEKEVFRVREKAKVRISVKRADNRPLPKGQRIAVAAVDEGLLELMQNPELELLDSMMAGGYEVPHSNCADAGRGKRHYGLKALPQGGGGGSRRRGSFLIRLLLWKGRVQLMKRARHLSRYLLMTR